MTPLLPFNSKELKVFCVKHVINDVPMSVWEQEYKDRRHLTVTNVRNGHFIKTNIPMFSDVNEYKRECITWAYTKTGKLKVDAPTRISKTKDKSTGYIVRKFKMCMLLLDHLIVVTTDPTDTTIVSVGYEYEPNEFLLDAQKELGII